jgi:hypothetical protein
MKRLFRNNYPNQENISSKYSVESQRKINRQGDRRSVSGYDTVLNE